MCLLDTIAQRERTITEQGFARSVRVTDGERQTVITDFTEYWQVCCKDLPRPVEPGRLRLAD